MNSRKFTCEILHSPGPREEASVPWGFEKFDGVAGGVLKQDLFAAPALDDLIAQASPRVTYGLNLVGEVVDLQLDAVPAARLGPPAVGHGLARSAGTGLVQQEAQVASREDRETGGGVKLDTEAEPLGVERDRLLDVINYVTHTDRGHRYRPSSSVTFAYCAVRASLAVSLRSRRSEQLARLEPRLQAREDHRPAAVELVVRVLAKLVMSDGQAAGVADRFDLPGDPRGSLALHVIAPERNHTLDKPAWRVDLKILSLAEEFVRIWVAHLIARAGRPIGADP